jgi:cyanophycinase
MRLLLVFCFFYSTMGISSDCLNPKIERFKVQENWIKIHSSKNLKIEDQNVQNVIISLHGTLRNGNEYFKDLCESVKSKLKTTLVVAPTFKREGDSRDEGELFWGRRWYQKWKYGYTSIDTHISSYEVMDQLIESFEKNNKYPNLKNITLIGHSAGGQFIQRYAAGTTVTKQIKPDLKLVVSNPSSYLYFHPERIEHTPAGYFSYTPDKNECPDYNEYIYGIENGLPEYFNKFTYDKLITNYKRNPVIYLMSEEDKETDYLDRSCGANTQGKNRIDRAYNYFQYLRSIIPDHHHQFKSISGIGHDHLKVFQSIEAQDIFSRKKTPLNININKIGKNIDKKVKTNSSFILMGGGGNDPEGFKFLLNETNGGDLVILSTKSRINHRYTHYLWSLAKKNNIKVNSITTISTKNKNASYDPKAIEILKKADAIFLTGGDQYRYFSYWEGTPLLKLLQEKINQGLPLGGSSAGLAIMGEFYFSAKNGTIYSDQALHKPETAKIHLQRDLITHPLMKNIITDTHFTERNREGRLLAFINRANKKYHQSPIGIGVDENTTFIITNEYTRKTGAGNILIYDLFYKNLELNLGRIRRTELIINKIYPPFSSLDQPYDILTVTNGEINILD